MGLSLISGPLESLETLPIGLVKVVHHPQKGLQNALRFIFLAILHFSASESIKTIDININAFEIWHFEFFCGIVLFLCILYIKSDFFFNAYL